MKTNQNWQYTNDRHLKKLFTLGQRWQCSGVLSWMREQIAHNYFASVSESGIDIERKWNGESLKEIQSVKFYYITLKKFVWKYAQTNEYMLSVLCHQTYTNARTHAHMYHAAVMLLHVLRFFLSALRRFCCFFVFIAVLLSIRFIHIHNRRRNSIE